MEALIYTTRGNMSVSMLDYATRWEDTADYTKLIETYTYEGEIVRQSVHVMGKTALEIGAIQQQF